MTHLMSTQVIMRARNTNMPMATTTNTNTTPERYNTTPETQQLRKQNNSGTNSNEVNAESHAPGCEPRVTRAQARTSVAIVAFVVHAHACRPSQYLIDPTVAPHCTITGPPSHGITKPHRAQRWRQAPPPDLHSPCRRHGAWCDARTRDCGDHQMDGQALQRGLAVMCIVACFGIPTCRPSGHLLCLSLAESYKIARLFLGHSQHGV